MDINEVLTQINVYQQDYSGVADVRYAHAAFSAEWGDSGSDNNLPLIYGSSVTVFLDAEFDYEYLYLFSANSKKHRVEIIKGGSLLGKWFIEPDTWNEPLIATPYPCQFTAYDGLGFLADTDYVPDGRKPVGTILSEILDLTGLSLNVNTEIDWSETVGDLLSSTIDTTVFNGLSCYEVLEQLFEGCRIYQRGGEWHVVSYTSLASASAATITDQWVEGEPEMEILPAIKQLVVKQDFGYNNNLLINGSFDKFNDELAKFDTWDNISVTPEQRDLNKDGDKYIYIPGQQYPGRFKDGGYGLITHGVTKSLTVRQTASKVNFELKYALMGAKYGSLMFIGIKLVGSNSSYYLRRARYIEETEVRWEWVNSVTKEAWNPIGLYHDAPVPTGDDHICLKSHQAVSAYNGSVLKHPYYNTFDNVTTWPYNQIADHFENFKAVVDGLPVDGQLQLFLYVPYTDRPQIAGSCFTGIKLELLDENAEKYPTETTYNIVNTTRNNYSPDDLSLKVGDYPTVINNKIIYSGGFRRANDTDVTTQWTVAGGSVAYTYAEFIGRLLAAAQSSPRQVYNARLADVIPSVNIIVADPNNPDKLFLENGITYDDGYQAVEGRFTELIAMNLDACTVEGSTAYIVPATKQVEVVADPKNIEERVSLIDENGALVSSPGYMYANDFEKKTVDPDNLELDGKVRLQIKREAITPYNLDQAAGQLQFSLTSVAEANYGGNANQVKFSAGQFLIHNFKALDKDARLTALEP